MVRAVWQSGRFRFTVLVSVLIYVVGTLCRGIGVSGGSCIGSVSARPLA